MITENILYGGYPGQKSNNDSMLFIIIIVILIFALSSFCSCMLLIQLSNKKGSRRVQPHTHTEDQIIHNS
jgi:hypothetical protein